MSPIYCRSNYSPRRAVLRLLRILADIVIIALFAYTVYGAATAEETAKQLTREQFRNDQLELRIRDLEKENRLLQQDVAILYNINNLGDYCSPKEE